MSDEKHTNPDDTEEPSIDVEANEDAVRELVEEPEPVVDFDLGYELGKHLLLGAVLLFLQLFLVLQFAHVVPLDDPAAGEGLWLLANTSIVATGAYMYWPAIYWILCAASRRFGTWWQSFRGSPS